MLRLSIFLALSIMVLWFIIPVSAHSESEVVPDTIEIGYIQDRFGPVFFDHATHVDLAESCGACHHIHNEEVNSTCSDCHRLSSETFRASAEHGFPACSGCHMDYSPEEPAMPGLKVALHMKCFSCHVGMAELGSSPSGCVQVCHEE